MSILSKATNLYDSLSPITLPTVGWHNNIDFLLAPFHCVGLPSPPSCEYLIRALQQRHSSSVLAAIRWVGRLALITHYDNVLTHPYDSQLTSLVGSTRPLSAAHGSKRKRHDVVSAVARRYETLRRPSSASQIWINSVLRDDGAHLAVYD